MNFSWKDSVLSWLQVHGLHLVARGVHSTNDLPNSTFCSLKTRELQWCRPPPQRGSDVMHRPRSLVFEALPRLNVCSDGDPQDKSRLFRQPGHAENFTPESSHLCLTGSSAETKSAEWLDFEKSCRVEWKRCDKILPLDLLVSFGLFYLHRRIFSSAPSGGWLQNSSQAPPTPC